MEIPKLIILNGPLAIGKSTLAQMYADDHQLTLNLDMDNVRSMLGQWRDQRHESGVLCRQLCVAMARAVLNEGHDVVLAQMFRSNADLDMFESLAREVNARYYEILLHTDKVDAISRCDKRGYTPGGLLDRGGRGAMAAQFYDEMAKAAEQRPQTIVIDSVEGSPDQTYAQLLSKVAD